MQLGVLRRLLRCRGLHRPADMEEYALVLRTVQKHPRVLKCIRSFLARSLSISAKLGKRGDSAQQMWVCGVLNCKQILQQLLECWTPMQSQIQAAAGCQTLLQKTQAQVNSELRSLTGNQTVWEAGWMQLVEQRARKDQRHAEPSGAG